MLPYRLSPVYSRSCHIAQYQPPRNYRFDRQTPADLAMTPRPVYGDLHHMTSPFYGGGDDESRSLVPMNNLVSQLVDSGSEFALDHGTFPAMTSSTCFRQGAFYRRSESSMTAIKLPINCSSNTGSADIKKEPRDLSYDISGI